MPVTRAERRVRALFGAVLHLYPASYRDEYGREMTLVLVDRLRGEHNAAARVVVLFAAVASVFADAPEQHAFVLAQDLRLAFRLIWRERWFATVAIGTVALGIALSTAVFSAWDPLSQGVTIALLCAVAVAAAWIPARRAMRVDPATVLRME